MDLLLASAAIPAAFPPVRYEGRFLSDGGLSNNAPVSMAISLGASRVIALSTGFSRALSEPPRGALATALHALNLLIMGVSPFDFSTTPDLIKRAEASTCLWLSRDGLSAP